MKELGNFTLRANRITKFHLLIALLSVVGLYSLFYYKEIYGSRLNYIPVASDNTGRQKQDVVIINEESSAHHQPNAFISSNSITTDSLVGVPWPDDPTCHHFTTRFAANGSHPKFVLTSYPGSGVTWTRQLIEGVTGIYTGTVYGSSENPILKKGHHGNKIEPNCECHILIKDHDVYSTETYATESEYDKIVNQEGYILHRKQYGGRGVVLVRNPIDAVVAYHHLKNTEDQTGVASEEKFRGAEWDAHVRFVAYVWAEHATRWIRDIQTGTVLFYERLLHEDTAAELQRVMIAIGFRDLEHPPFNEERMRCTVAHKGRTDRRRSNNKSRILLTLEQRTAMNKSISLVQDALKEKGWPPLPIHLYDFHET